MLKFNVLHQGVSSTQQSLHVRVKVYISVHVIKKVMCK